MSYRLRWYTDEGNLRSLGQEHLNQLLDRYATELRDADITTPAFEDDETFYRELAKVFMRPEGIPAPLHDALFHIKALDNDRGEERLVMAVKEGFVKIDLAGEHSTADKALLAWLQDEELVKRLHVQVDLDRSKSFITFLPQGDTTLRCDLRAVAAALELDLAPIFGQHGRGKWAEVGCHERGDELMFVIRHAEPFRRDTEKRDTGAEPRYFWPVGQDLVIFSRSYGDLRTNATARWLKEAYAKSFGFRLFGRADLFKEAPKYTLEPLRTMGLFALLGAAYGIESIQLQELETLVDRTTDDRRIRRATDVLAAYDKEGGLPTGEPLMAAKFRVRFKGRTHDRIVTIRVPNRAKYTQDKEGQMVTEWLKDTGFIVKDEGEDSET
ncbi:MAG: hypothetical protein H7A46_25690 [Verrucomicrobiales bacterium]|nr:hypothetical protein [Verrucomicrobiales bacterium]